MRLYVFLVLALFALAARAATIPDDAPLSITVPENVFDEKEPIEKANIINDVDNKLRNKPFEVPEVAEQALKTSDESEEIIRPAVDLRNPGPPQRQEHETQNPEFSAEQNIVQTYKQNLNDAQAFLRQGLTGVSEGFQNIFGNNEQIKVAQENIQKLREGFIAQINSLNETVQTFLNGDGTNNVSPAQEQTKAGVQIIEAGLNRIKNDFTRGVNTIADGIESVRAENENPSSGATPAPANPIAGIQSWFGDLQTNFQNGLSNVTTALNNLMNQNQNQPPAAAQADDPNNQATGNPTPSPGTWGSGTGPIYQLVQSFQNTMSQMFQFGQQPAKPAETTVSPAPTEVSTAAQSDPQRVETIPKEPVVQADQAVPVTTIGPIRQILQNNPVSQGIAATIQRLQNINNPEKPREPVKVKATSLMDLLLTEDEKKGHSPGSGDNNNSNDSGVVDTEPANEIQKQTLPEEEAKPQKTEEVVDKTE